MLEEHDHDSQLIFIYPRNPEKSFTYPYTKPSASSLKLDDLFKAIEAEKHYYFKFADAFGREIPRTNTLDEFLSLQPFYITQMIPCTITLFIRIASSNDVIYFDVDPMDKIEKVEEYIQRTKGFHKKQQQYFIENRLINRYSTLMFHNICKSGTEIRLILKPTLTILWNQQSFDLYVELSQPVHHLHHLIQEKTGIEQERQLIMKGYRELENKETFIDLSIRDSDTLTVLTKARVFFVLLDWKVQEYHLTSTRIFDLKRQLCSRQDFFQAGDKLFDFELQGVLLEDDRSLGDYTRDMDIELQIVPREGVLVVKLSTGIKVVHMLIQEYCSIGYLKRHFVNIHERGIRIYHRGQELTSRSIMWDYKDRDGIVQLNFDLDYYGEIYIQSLSCYNFTLEVHSHDTISKIKQKIQKIKNIDPDEQQLIFQRMLLQDDKDLAEYLILSGSTVHFVLNLCGGGRGGSGAERGGAEFVNFTEPSKAVKLKRTDNSSTWRSITMPGLSLEGKCMNRVCKGYRQWVVINKGIGTYDVVLDEHKNQCPLCGEYISVEKCGFNNCHYTYSGIMCEEDGSMMKKVTPQKEVRVENSYMPFDPEIAGKIMWLSLKIVTKSLNYNYKGDLWCSICISELHMGQKTLKCGHVFHRRCLEKVNHLEVECVVCHL